MNIDSLQPSLVVREYKRILTDKYKLSKDAKDTIVLSTNIFIHYITTLALEYAQRENKSTIQPKYILQALESAGFDEMIPELEQLLQQEDTNDKSTKEQTQGE